MKTLVAHPVWAEVGRFAGENEVASNPRGRHLKDGFDSCLRRVFNPCRRIVAAFKLYVGNEVFY